MGEGDVPVRKIEERDGRGAGRGIHLIQRRGTRAEVLEIIKLESSDAYTVPTRRREA